VTSTPGTRIAAVVVTFNRLELLQRLLERLDAVPGLDEVLVIDNASTDGTAEFLSGLDGARSGDEHRVVPVLSRTLTENAGGAGGFHDGLAWAMERGADLAWLMDDDGLPDVDCLGILLAAGGVGLDTARPTVDGGVGLDTARPAVDGGVGLDTGAARPARPAVGARPAAGARLAAGARPAETAGATLDFWGPVVVDQDAPGRLVFPIRLPGGTRVVHELADVRAAARGGRIDDIVIPFNGVLVTRALVERIGLPRSEYFIWGDDHEYRLRAEAAGARIATVVDATVRHPSVGSLGTPMLGGRTTYNHTPSDLKHYCMARNNLLNLRDYRGWPHALAFVAKTLWFYTVTRPDPRRIALSARAWWAALRGDFTGHRRYL
jgi:rhamnopyranosyl-N-acetylglucosaminyl-diphospho-decaprenol beta-1,3/1,4-galactofuranosyltransferase